MKADLKQAQVTILIQVNGEVCLVAMGQDKYDAVSLLAKASAEKLYTTHKTQAELNQFLGL